MFHKVQFWDLSTSVFNVFVFSLSCQVHLYADDTYVYCVADSIQLAIENLELSFNAFTNLKLVFMNIKQNSHCLLEPEILIIIVCTYLHTANGSNTEGVISYKYPGIWLIRNVHLNINLDNLVSKLCKKLFYRNGTSFPMISRIVEALFPSV